MSDGSYQDYVNSRMGYRREDGSVSNLERLFRIKFPVEMQIGILELDLKGADLIVLKTDPDKIPDYTLQKFTERLTKFLERHDVTTPVLIMDHEDRFSVVRDEFIKKQLVEIVRLRDELNAAKNILYDEITSTGIQLQDPMETVEEMIRKQIEKERLADEQQ